MNSEPFKLLAALEEGVWLHWAAEGNGVLAEERRLFYVGLTRAIDYN